MDELSNKSKTNSEISMTVFEVRSSDEELTPANDRFSKADGFHAVPPPITGNFLTPRADISFAGLDEYAIRKKIIKSKTDTSKSKTSETVGNTNEVNVEKPKSVNESVVSTPNINKDKVIIEDWNSDDENDVSEVSPVKTNETQTAKTQVDKIGQTSKKAGIGFKKIKACFVCKSTDHLIKDCDFYDKKSPEPKLKNMVNTGQRVVKPVWDNAKRVNHQKFSNKLNYPQARRTFVPSGVLTRTGLVNPVRPNEKRAVQTVSTARPVSTARSVSTARPFTPKIAQSSSAIRPIYPRMDNVRPRASYSPIKRVRWDTDLKKSKGVLEAQGKLTLDHVSKEVDHHAQEGNPEILLQDHAVSVSMKKRLARKKSLKTKLMQKESVSKQGRKPAKSKPTVHKDPAFDDLDDAMDYMETEDAHDEGTVKDSKETRVSIEDQVSTDRPKVSTDKLKVSTDKLKVSTDKPNEGTAEPNEGTAEPKDGNSDERFEIKEIKDTDRPRTTTERSILTLNPHPKIDPKDKGKKVLKKKAESDAESKGVNEAEKKFKMLANDEEITRKVQEEWEAEEDREEKFLAHKDLRLSKQRSYKKSAEKPNDDILEVKRANENFIPVGSAKDEKLIEKMNKKAAGMDKEEVSEEPESTKTDFDHERRNHLRTIPKDSLTHEEEEKIDYEVLGTRYPIINWESKFYDYDHFGRELIYYRVFRADGNLRWIKTFFEMIKFFDRMDLVEIHSLVMKRFETTPPKELISLRVFEELIFESKEMMNSEEIKKSGSFKAILLLKTHVRGMMDLRVDRAVSDDDTIFDFLRFIEQQIDEFGGQDGNILAHSHALYIILSLPDVRDLHCSDCGWRNVLFCHLTVEFFLIRVSTQALISHVENRLAHLGYNNND
ncbi:hypothetical protein Tco_0088750 [Tanacetum coccineum]